MAPQDYESLRANLEQVRAEVLHMDERVLLLLHRVGLAGPVNHPADGCIDDGHEFRMRTRSGAGGTAAMIVS